MTTPQTTSTLDRSNDTMDDQTFTFTQQLMASNERLMDRTERLLEQQERYVKLLGGKEDTIMQLKRALEHEKEWREQHQKKRPRTDSETMVQGKVEELSPADDVVSNPFQDEKLLFGQSRQIDGSREWDGLGEQDLDLPIEDFQTQVQHSSPGLRNLQTMIANHFPSYTFRPWIDEDNGYGRLADLSEVVVRSLVRSLERFQLRREQKNFQKCPETPTQQPVACGELWMHGCSSTRAWTRDSPGRYACKTCFTARRACFVWKAPEWVILPLPPQVREAGMSWRDAGYYVFGKMHLTAKAFPGVWDESYDTLRKREKERREAATVEEVVYEDDYLRGFIVD